MRPPFGIGCGISGQRVWRPAVMDVFSIFIFSSVHGIPRVQPNKVQDLEENISVQVKSYSALWIWNTWA
ncbi:hypothetical protein BS47DRAFT_187144 [Hydnum rufescens UP504]|uniref:Uncharacterized protein n=1 Tax=Hydnum rufescens UP504 TaxID=1448309 RepID=A0A9P6ANC2_9AGAM|nr:hypothetical protein BS47DRAFT_187144 [Hydnum rufescens UP504]